MDMHTVGGTGAQKGQMASSRSTVFGPAIAFLLRTIIDRRLTLGRKREALSTKEIYAPFDPDHLSDAVQVVDGSLNEVVKSPDIGPLSCLVHDPSSFDDFRPAWA